MIKIVKTDYLNGYQVRLVFSDGAHGDYDFSSLLANDTALTRPLKDTNVFKIFSLSWGRSAGRTVWNSARRRFSKRCVPREN